MQKPTKTWNVLVIGGGHAGIEAAHAAAKLGSTALMIGNPATLGRMPCNPAVGGPGKSQLVFEVVALGGLMGQLADQTAIHTRTLNASKGPAVQSLRVQNERDAYAEYAQEVMLGRSDIDILRSEAADLESDDQGGWWVVGSDGRHWHARSVVIAAGTFMRGVTWYGRQSRPEGRQGEPPARFLSEPLARAGHTLKRYKTGTPPRVRADSVNFAELLEIGADPKPRGFTGKIGTGSVGLRATECPTWQTHTTPQTHQLIHDNLHLSPMYAGDIAGLGPRYCPSIEDKVVKFAHHDRHLLFVEPDGLQTSEVYLQGFSSSLPPSLQDQLVRSLPAFESAVIQRYAYAVEYDVIDSTELTLNMESKLLRGIFSAGQINGTSGYEEAAAQGLVAGLSAARRGLELEEVFIGRETGYLGVLLDDLVFKGSDEPYRMMTSRVEHRLLVRQDNADERLTKLGHELGLVSSDELARVTTKYQRIAEASQKLSKQRHEGQTGEAWLRRPEFELADLEAMGFDISAAEGSPLNDSEREALQIRTKYEGYIKRAKVQLAAEAKARRLSLAGVDFAVIGSLSNEAREKLSKLQPQTVEQAARISGVRHADISALLVHLRRGR